MPPRVFRHWVPAFLGLLLLAAVGCSLPPSTPGAPPAADGSPAALAGTPGLTTEPAANVPTAGAPSAVPATPCPVPATPGPTSAQEATAPASTVAEDCDATYRQLLAEHSFDYGTCAPAFAQRGDCPRPESLTGELKETINIQLILDSSGSMAEQMGAQTKLQIAQAVLSRFVDSVPPTANVALRVYGHTGSNSEADRAESCRGTELRYDFQPLDAAAFTAAIASFQPTGWTPIAASLDAARADFARFDPATSTNLIYLVSDGIETCDGDPVAAARALNDAAIQTVVNVVGFAVDAEAAQQLRDTAAAGGGAYYEARNAAELEQIFTERFDWAAWSAYYLCQVGGATREFLNNVTEQNRAFLCVVTNANQEYLGVISATNQRFTRQQLSSTCAATIRQQVQTRRDALLDAATNRRMDVVFQAQEEREAAIREAEGLRPTLTPHTP